VRLLGTVPGATSMHCEVTAYGGKGHYKIVDLFRFWRKCG